MLLHIYIAGISGWPLNYLFSLVLHCESMKGGVTRLLLNVGAIPTGVLG